MSSMKPRVARSGQSRMRPARRPSAPKLVERRSAIAATGLVGVAEGDPALVEVEPVALSRQRVVGDLGDGRVVGQAAVAEVDLARLRHQERTAHARVTSIAVPPAVASDRTPGGPTLAAVRLRSLLFAPGNQGEVLAKLPRSGPDGVVLDLEDAVPADAKGDARAVVAEVAPGLIADHPGLAVFVRINAVPSEWFADDVAALPSGLAGIVVPKLESADQVDALPDLPVVAGLETAAGVARAQDVLAPDRVVAGYFGAEDFIADMGGVRTPEGTEVLYARSQVALAARLTGTLAIDQVVTDLRDEARFRADAAVGRSLGYRGKLCIHPAQVSWAHEAFSPSADELDRARRLLAAYEEANAAGSAAIAFEGQMVDEPLARQAQALLDAAT